MEIRSLHREDRRHLRGVRKGQREAYESIICQHYKSIYGFLVYLTGDASLAEDLTQETFVSAWAKINSYEGRASIKTWLHQIAYHKFIDLRRKVGRTADLLNKLSEENDAAQETFNPLRQLLAAEHLRFLYKAMYDLEFSDRVMVLLHYIQSLSFRDMAKVLDEPVGTVKWQTSQALKRLRALLTGRI